VSALLPAVLAASLLGSPHCAGMCGGFVAFYAAGDRSTGLRRAAAHAAYSVGRLASYMVLGVAAGILGRAMDLAGAAAGWQRGASTAAGGLMILWGGVMLLQVRGLRIGTGLPPTFRRLVDEALGQLADKPPLVKALVLGLLSTLLPCGWLYAFAITAAGTGDPIQGALVMAFFWLGTLPVLIGLGLSVQLLAGPLRRHLPTLSAVLLILVGLLTVLDRTRLPVERFGEIGPAVLFEKGGQARPGQLASELPCCEDGVLPDSTGRGGARDR
jgi:uncharacterized protein